MDSDNLFFDHSSIMISGATGCGKTFWIHTLLHRLQDAFETTPDKILYCYGAYQPLFDEMKTEFPNLIFHEGLPDEAFFRSFADPKHHRLVILDDLMSDVSQSRDGEHLFTRGCHHLNLTVCYLVQNLFPANKHSRTISLNSQYLLVFRNLRDKQQISRLAQQIYPSYPQLLTVAYEDATAEPYGYVLINLHPKFTDENSRVRARLFELDTVHYELDSWRRQHELKKRMKRLRNQGSKRKTRKRR